MKKRYLWMFLRKNNAESTAEGGTNRAAWWIAAIALFAIIGGVACYIVGNMISDAQTGSTTTITSLSSQSGLNTLATAVEANNQTIGTAAPAGGYKAP